MQDGSQIPITEVSPEPTRGNDAAPSPEELADRLRQLQIDQVKAGMGRTVAVSHRKNPHHKSYTKRYAGGQKVMHEPGPRKWARPSMSDKALARARKKAQDRIDILHAVVVENERRRFYEQAAGQGRAQAAEAWLIQQAQMKQAADMAADLGLPPQLLDEQSGTIVQSGG